MLPRRPLRWILPGALALAAAAVVGSALGQTMSGMGSAEGQQSAQSFAASQQGMIANGVSSSSAALLPSSSGDTSSLQGLQSNPSALTSSGASAASTSTAFGTVSAGATNAKSQPVSITDSWLQQSLQIVSNPTSVLQATGSQAQTCTTSTTQQPVVDASGTYTCETSQPITDASSSCSQTLVVDTTTSYTYACTSTYNQASRVWVVSSACQTLGSTPGCSPTGTTCTTPAAPTFQATSCTAGTEWSAASQTCTETRQIVLGATYSYTCSNAFDGVGQSFTPSSACAALSANAACTQTGSSCTAAGAPTTRTCEQGTVQTSGTEVCTSARNITIGTNYTYVGTRSLAGSTWTPDGPEMALQAAGSTCQVQATNCTATSPAAVYTCQTGYSTTNTSQTCNQNLSVQTAPYWQYSCRQAGVFNHVDNVWEPDTVQDCSAFLNSPTCTTTQTGTWNQLYYATYRGPGQTYTQPVFTATCSSAVNVGSGKGASYIQLLSQGATGVNDTWETCSQDSGSCTPAGTVCLDNGGARTINGYQIYRACWTRAKQYICPVQTPAAGCSPPAGSSQTGNTCAASDSTGACTEFTQTWTTPGTCTTATDQWLCTGPAPGAGTPISTQSFVASDTWSTTCGSLSSNPSCSLASDVVTDGPSTKTIDGLAVTRADWAHRLTYTCTGAPSPIDTCTGQVNGCTLASQACAANDSSGACTAWNYTYSCPATGAGACSQETYSYTCSADVPAADPASAVTQHVVSDGWTTQCQALASNTACTLTSDVNDGASTRTIGGVAVTENGWTKTDTYTCPASQPIDGCTGAVTGCTQTGKTCAGNDPSGACSVWTYAYSCPSDDGSGGCAVETSTYTCASDVPAADPAVSTHTTETGTHWNQACPQASNINCQSQGASCTDATPTKIVNGIAVAASCWAQTTTYECETKGAVTTDCNPPAGCTHDHDECLDDPPPADGSCVSTDHVYVCTTASTKSVTQSSCSTQMCVQGQCFTISGANDSNDLGKAYAALSTAQSAGADYANAVNNLKVMSGKPLRCRKSVLGFSNCCKDSGWGQDIGLASCDSQEKSLIADQKSKSCHYVGTYCSNKSFFGVCLEKSMRYCCFEGALARIINEAGRPQVGKTWGGGKNPDCSGFTIAQFQQLDLSNVDFSDFYTQALSKLAAPDGANVTSNIQSTLQKLYDGGTPTNLPALSGH